MITDNFCFYLQNRLIQISQTGGQWYSDISPFSIPWFHLEKLLDDVVIRDEDEGGHSGIDSGNRTVLLLEVG
jgi:hypothetical protein